MPDRDSSYQPLKSPIRAEMKGILSAFIAFSVAILILVIEGSIRPESVVAFLALSLITLSIPIGVASYILALKMLSSPRTPEIGHRKYEWSMTLSMSSTLVGFILLVFDAIPFLGGVLSIALLGSFVFLMNASRAWDRSLVGSSNRNSEDDKLE